MQVSDELETEMYCPNCHSNLGRLEQSRYIGIVGQSPAIGLLERCPALL